MKDDIKLGQFLTDETERDAIHVAVIPVTYVTEKKYDYVRPGERIKFLPNSTTHVRSVVSHYDKGDGIVDPFLNNTDRIENGSRFYMFLYPNTVTGMQTSLEMGSN